MSTLTADKLRTARIGRGLSQDELAELLRQHGAPTASKRMVQRWESGLHRPGRHYTQVLAAALGSTPDELGLPPVVEDASGRHVRAGAPFAPPDEEGLTSDGRLPGIWLSRYQYWSTGRQALYISQYYCLLVNEGTEITVHSLPLGQRPALHLHLFAEGHILTGTWDEVTDPAGHYLGDRRWGALQLLLTPSHRYMHGKWVGWGSGGLMNSGPWDLRWITADTSTDQFSPYNTSLPDEPVYPPTD